MLKENLCLSTIRVVEKFCLNVEDRVLRTTYALKEPPTAETPRAGKLKRWKGLADRFRVDLEGRGLGCAS